MTPIRKTTLLFGAMLLFGAASGCGKVANVLTSQEDGGPRPGKDGGGGRGNGDFDGGVAAFGAGTSNHPGGGKGGGGTGAGRDASAGGASNGAAPGGTGAAGAASPFPDPHGAERKALIDRFCSPFDAYPCLSPSVILGDTLHSE